MIVDSSAIIAILLGEPEEDKFLDFIYAATEKLISAANFVEVGIVMQAKFGEQGVAEFELFIMKSQIQVAPVSATQAQIALLAFQKYGKGQNAAGLNYGDCFAYALAKETGYKLLYKGKDFKKTDIESF